MSGKTSGFQALHNRILIRNSHKYVFKKVIASQKQQWCQKYLTVASPKLTQPYKINKLPYSIKRKKCKTEFDQNKSNIKTFYHKKVAIITDMQKTNTIDDDQSLVKGKQCQKIFLQRRKTQKRPSFNIKKKIYNIENILEKSNKYNISAIQKNKQNFSIQPWSVQKDGQDIKENFFC